MFAIALGGLTIAPDSSHTRSDSRFLVIFKGGIVGKNPARGMGVHGGLLQFLTSPANGIQYPIDSPLNLTHGFGYLPLQSHQNFAGIVIRPRPNIIGLLLRLGDNLPRLSGRNPLDLALLDQSLRLRFGFGKNPLGLQTRLRDEFFRISMGGINRHFSLRLRSLHDFVGVLGDFTGTAHIFGKRGAEFADQHKEFVLIQPDKPHEFFTFLNQRFQLVQNFIGIYVSHSFLNYGSTARSRRIMG